MRCDPDLAYDWLKIFAHRDPALAVRGPVIEAVDALREPDRIDLIEALVAGPIAASLIPRLVGRTVHVYAALLKLDGLKDFHLRPLAGKPDEEWTGLAKLAMAEGHEPRSVAEACFEVGHAWSGYGQEYWSRWDRAFAELENNPEKCLREVARYGRKLAQEDARRAAARKRQHELDGL